MSGHLLEFEDGRLALWEEGVAILLRLHKEVANSNHLKEEVTIPLHWQEGVAPLLLEEEARSPTLRQGVDHPLHLHDELGVTLHVQNVDLPLHTEEEVNMPLHLEEHCVV